MRCGPHRRQLDRRLARSHSSLPGRWTAATLPFRRNRRAATVWLRPLRPAAESDPWFTSREGHKYQVVKGVNWPGRVGLGRRQFFRGRYNLSLLSTAGLAEWPWPPEACRESEHDTFVLAICAQAAEQAIAAAIRCPKNPQASSGSNFQCGRCRAADCPPVPASFSALNMRAGEKGRNSRLGLSLPKPKDHMLVQLPCSEGLNRRSRRAGEALCSTP